MGRWLPCPSSDAGLPAGACDRLLRSLMARVSSIHQGSRYGNLEPLSWLKSLEPLRLLSWRGGLEGPLCCPVRVPLSLRCVPPFLTFVFAPGLGCPTPSPPQASGALDFHHVWQRCLRPPSPETLAAPALIPPRWGQLRAVEGRGAETCSHPHLDTGGMFSSEAGGSFFILTKNSAVCCLSSPVSRKSSGQSKREENLTFKSPSSLGAFPLPHDSPWGMLKWQILEHFM